MQGLYVLECLPPLLQVDTRLTELGEHFNAFNYMNA